MQIDITALLLGVLSVIGGIVTGVVAPYIRAKTTLSQRAALQSLVTAAVTAAEQIYRLGEGDIKKQYVLDWLEKRGISVDKDELDAMVEAAVYTLKMG